MLVALAIIAILTTLIFSGGRSFLDNSRNAPNFPEGFHAGYELRGFAPGRARFPLSAAEMALMDDIRARIACVLTDCGFSEAAHACRTKTAVPDGDLRATVEAGAQSVGERGKLITAEVTSHPHDGLLRLPPS